MLTKTLGNQLPVGVSFIEMHPLFFIWSKQVFICSLDPLAMGFTGIRPKFGSTQIWLYLAMTHNLENLGA
jgi:hypothetical protein